jgi:uracil-DNA glycosylase
MGTSIPRRDLVRAAHAFALPQITIVRPKLVICLGLVTFNALREACGFEPVYPIATAIRSPFNLAETRIWCQAHTGARGQNNRNSGRKRVPNDWKQMKNDVSLKA